MTRRLSRLKSAVGISRYKATDNGKYIKEKSLIKL